MSKSRIYVVEKKDKESGEVTDTRLVRSGTGNQAERYVMAETIDSRPADPNDVEQHMAKGGKVESVI